MTIRILLFALLVALLGFGFAYRLTSQRQEILPKNSHIKFEATIKSEPKISYGRQVITIADARIYTDLYPGFQVGERILVEGFVDADGRIFSPNIRQFGEQKVNFISALRNSLSANIGKLLPAREAALVQGMVLGVDNLDAGLKDSLVKTGTIHVVVVSGQNLAIVAGVFLGLAKLIGRRTALVLALAASVFYALLTGFQPPVIRAVLMVASVTLATFFGRQVSAIWAIVLSAGIIIFFWPSAVFDISFQLTFAATLGIATFGQYLARISNFKSQISNLLLKNAAVATSAFLFTMPVIIYHFGRLSLISPLANIVVAEAVFPVMMLGFLIAIVSLLLMPLAQLLAYFAFLPALFFVKAVEIFARIPFGQMELGKGNLVLVIGCYLIIMLSLLIWTRKKAI